LNYTDEKNKLTLHTIPLFILAYSESNEESNRW
jgi:hypothetical protein